MGAYSPLWKHAIPPAPPDLIARPELVRRLDQAVRRPVTHVCAAPGYGKTTQLAMWARAHAGSVAWYSLDGRDGDLATFAAGLIASLRAAFGKELSLDRERALPAQLGPDAASDRTADATAEAIAEAVERAVTAPLVLVLDGCEALVWREARNGTVGDLQATRGWTDEEWAAAKARLAGRGWLDADGTVTYLGRQEHKQVEEQTDRLSAAPWERLDGRQQDRLVELLTPLSKALYDAIPNSVVGAPRPT
ncbi:hypothetical protein GCM10009557_35370 [Virgisporangium ochraceum]